MFIIAVKAHKKQGLKYRLQKTEQNVFYKRYFCILSKIVILLLQDEEKYIIAADDLAPSETIQLERERVLAFVTRQGLSLIHI